LTFAGQFNAAISIRSLSVTTTHALYLLKVQRKVSNDVARLAAASSLDPPKSGNFCHLSE